MFSRQPRAILNLHDMIIRNYETNFVGLSNSKHLCALFSTGSNYTELPREVNKSERKPWVTDINQLKRRARLEKLERQIPRELTLCPPENGLLVTKLIPIAHQVLEARAELFACVSKVVDKHLMYSCSLCGEVHVGDPPHKIRTCNVSGSKTNKEHSWERGGTEQVLPVVESFHLYDRLGRAVSHNERLQVDRIPAIVELCIQAGVDILEYPTRRRELPVYRVAGRMLDFEKRFPKDELSVKEINPHGFWEFRKKPIEDKMSLNLQYNDIQGFAMRGMESWDKMRSGVTKLMEKYDVQTCGYCSEVQVGPKGHRVRQCQAFKHQMRDGQHAWQEATIDDMVPPVYVWHVRDRQGERLLVDRLKRYYGKLPGVVELFAQAGAQVGENYGCVMREDVVVPGLGEEELVV